VSILISVVFVTQDRVVGTAEAAIKALYSGDFISNGTYPFEADSFVSVVKKHAVFIDDELVKVCESLGEAEEVVRKIERAINEIDQLGVNEPVSLLNLFDHKEMFAQNEGTNEEACRRIQL
jgi:hypothetical protein